MTSKTLNSLFKTAGQYTLTNVINSAIPFLMLPVYTRYLSPYDYGIVATFQILVSFISPFIGLSLYGAISVKYYDNSGVDLPKYITNCLIILSASTIITSTIIWYFSWEIGKFITFPAEWLWSIIVVSLGQFMVQVALALWQIRMKPIPYGIFQVVQTSMNLILAVIFVVVLRMNWEGRIIAQICCDVLFGFIAFVILYRDNWIKFEYNKEYIVSALKFGIPLIPHAIAGWAIAVVDRVFINKMIGVAETGIYTIGYQVAMVIVLIETSFNNAWVPWLFHNLNTGDPLVKTKIVKITYIYVTLLLSFALLLSVTAPWFMNILVGKEFYGSVKIIFWLALGKGIYSMYFMTCNYLFYMKRTDLVAFSTFSAAAIHIVATYYLVKYNGIIGAAQAGILSTFVLVSITWYYSNRIYKMPWSLRY